MLCHYLDNFVAVFKPKEATPSRIKKEARTYIWLTDVLGLLQNDSKDRKRTLVVVFGIEIDNPTFTAQFPKEKLVNNWCYN